MASPSHYLETESAFRKLLATGRQVALEDATPTVAFPEGFDKRMLGVIPRAMQSDGEIREAGFRRSVASTCNRSPKRLWVAVDPASIYRGRPTV